MIKTSYNTASWTIIGTALITFILFVVPFLSPLAYPFMLLSTLFHEMSHGIAAMLVGGHFESFKMWSDGSGVANISGQFGNIARAFVAASGLIGPAIFAALFFTSAKTDYRARIMLASCGIVLALSILLIVRNLFGVFFIAVVAGLCLYFSLGAGQKYSRAVLSFLAMQLSISVFSRSDYLFTQTAETSAGPMPSDVAQIANALVLPYWFWGAWCGLFSVLVLVYGIRQLFR